MGRDPSGMYNPDERAEQQRQRAAARKAKQAVGKITQAVLGNLVMHLLIPEMDL